MAFTFTERAAAEIKERIYARVTELLWKELAMRLGDLYVGTIQALCMRVLQDHYRHGIYDVLDPNQEMAFLLREAFYMGLGPVGAPAPTPSLSANCQTFQYSANIVQESCWIGRSSESSPPSSRRDSRSTKTFSSPIASSPLAGW